MSEQASPTDGRSGAGARLREAREALGLSARTIASQLNLSVAAVEALEEERYRDLPPATFVRGYFRSYARLVGLEPEEVVAQARVQPETGAPPEALPTEGIRGAGRSAAAGAGGDGPPRWMMPALVSVLTVFLAGGVWWLWTALDEEELMEAPEDVEVVEEAPLDDEGALGEPGEEPAAAEREAEAMEPDDGEGIPGEAPDEETVPAPAELPDETALTPELADAERSMEDALAAEGETATEEPEAPGSEVLLRIQDGGETWLQVTAGDETLQVGLVEGPEVIRFSGHEGYALVIGNADVVEVRYDGEEVALEPFTSGRVARLSLPQEE